MKNAKLKANSYKLKPNSGFTLIELLVVIAIIGLLSSIVLASLGTARDKAADAAIQADLVGVRSSAEIYFADNGNSYGTFSPGLCPTSGIGSIFHSPQVVTAITHAIAQNGVPNSAACGSDGSSYGVAVRLKTQSGGPFWKGFCVDSSGAAIIVDSVNGLMSSNPFKCIP